MKKKTNAKKEAAQKSAAEDGQVDFETALSHLEQVVNDLEAGRLGLSDSLAQYEKGVKYLRHCYELLENAEKKIGLLSGVDANGQPEIESFNDPGSTSLEEKAHSRARRRTHASGAKPIKQPAENNVGDDSVDLPGGLF